MALRHDLATIYRRHYGDQPRRERMLLSTLGFFNAFGGARVVTHAIRAAPSATSRSADATFTT